MQESKKIESRKKEEKKAKGVPKGVHLFGGTTILLARYPHKTMHFIYRILYENYVCLCNYIERYTWCLLKMPKNKIIYTLHFYITSAILFFFFI